MPQRVDVEKYLSSFNNPMSELALKTRNKILEIDKELDEEIKWNNLTYKKNGPLFAIVIHKNHINLEFWKGTDLYDPEQLIEGTGKRIRHFKIKDEYNISPQMEGFIKQAIDLDKKS